MKYKTKFFLSLLVVLCAARGNADQNVVIVFDDSASMGYNMSNNKSRMENAKNALVQVVSDLPADTKIGLTLLNGKKWPVPLGPVDKKEVVKVIQSLTANGGTPLGKAMKVGSDALLEARDKEHYGNYRLLVVTDGAAEDQNLVEKFLPDILSRGILVDVIGVDMAADHDLATKVHNYRRGDDPAGLVKALRETFAETNSNDSTNDFEVIASLPDEIATEMLKALTDVGNHPIGTAAPVKAVGSAAAGTNATAAAEEAGSVFKSMFLGIIGFGFACFAVYLIVSLVCR